MGRQSLESAKVALNALLTEQTRDRDALQHMIDHCSQMIETLQSMREQEELRIDAEAAERKAAARKMFEELISVEEERKERLSVHISDINGDISLDDEVVFAGHSGLNGGHAEHRGLNGGHAEHRANGNGHAD